jgi:hypothetical protein
MDGQELITASERRTDSRDQEALAAALDRTAAFVADVRAERLRAEDVAMNDINDGGDENMAQFSNDA